MTKPLELKTYRRVAPGEDGFWEYRQRVIKAKQKRLTDPELAAEYFRAEYFRYRAEWQQLSSGMNFPDEAWTTQLDQLNTLYRFATHPHYDEVQP